MAPKRGGGGISIGGGSVNNRCNDSDSFKQPVIIARITLDGLALASFLVIWYLYLGAKKKNPNLKEVFKFSIFGLLLASGIIYLILAILGTVLGSCFIVSYSETANFSVAVAVFVEISNILILGIVLLNLTLAVFRRTGLNMAIVKSVNSCVVGLVTLILVPTLILYGMSTVSIYDGSLSDSQNLTSISSKLYTAYYILYLIASLIGSTFLFFAVTKARKHPALDSKTKTWVVITVLSLLIGSLASVIQSIGWTIMNNEYTDSTFIAFYTIFQVFYVLTVSAILRAVTSASKPVVDPTNNATYDPDAPENGLHRRFTYTRPKDEQQAPPQYETPATYQYQVPQQHWNPPAGQFGHQTAEMEGRPVYEAPPSAYR